MKYISGLLVAGLFFLFTGNARAAFDGHALLQKCEPMEKLYNDPASLSSSEATGVIYCMGYIDSFMDTFRFQVQSRIVTGVPYCLPEEAPAKRETARAVVGYMKGHPEDLDKPAGYLLFMGLREAYPCGGTDNRDIQPEKKPEAGQQDAGK